MRKERIKKMIKLAMYEQYDGRRDLEICRLYRRDFVGLGLIANGVLITIAYVIVLLAVAIYNMDYLSLNFSKIDFGSVTFNVIFIYIVIIAVYSVIVFTIRRLRYAKAKRGVDRFYDSIRELQDFYTFDDITGKSTGRRFDNITGKNTGRRKVK